MSLIDCREGQACVDERLIGFDRDLSIAGRAMVKNGSGQFTQKLVKIDRPSKQHHTESMTRMTLVH